jgi:RNA polymerase sigma-70 factor, ECF subfamily
MRQRFDEVTCFLGPILCQFHRLDDHAKEFFFRLARLITLWNCPLYMGRETFSNHRTLRGQHGASYGGKSSDGTDLTNTDNFALLDGLKSGCPKATCEFCDRFGPRINRWVWRLLGADAEHDDMVQQIYMGFFASMNGLKNVDSLDAFVDSITIRTVRKEIRRRKYRRLFLVRGMESDDANVADGSHGLKDAHIRIFYRILNELGTEERMVFVLKHFEGLTMEEIAHISGYSVRTAKRRLYRAMDLMKERLLAEPVLISLLEEF